MVEYKNNSESLFGALYIVSTLIWSVRRLSFQTVSAIITSLLDNMNQPGSMATNILMSVTLQHIAG
jgi:hypothetical protein